MEVDCSKGNIYPYSCAMTLERSFRWAAVWKNLSVRKSADFLKEDAVTLDEVRQKMEQGEGAELFTPLDQIFAELPAVTADEMRRHGCLITEMIFRKRFLLEKEDVDRWTGSQSI